LIFLEQGARHKPVRPSSEFESRPIYSARAALRDAARESPVAEGVELTRPSFRRQRRNTRPQIKAQSLRRWQSMRYRS
jgi:hypothetical protein